MERCLLVWHVGTNGWTNRVPDCEIWAREKPKMERNRKSKEGYVSRGERNQAGHIYITGLTQHHGATCSMMQCEPAFSDTWHSCAACRQFRTRLTFLTPVLPIWELTKVGTQTEIDFTVSENGHENRENLSEQKLSHLFFFRRSLCQTIPNKEEATVITLFLPPGFFQVLTCKTRQPGLSRVDLKRVQLHLRVPKT